LAYGEWRLHQNDFAEGPKVALTQSNLDLRMKIDVFGMGANAVKASESMREHQERLTNIAARRKPDLIVWPETSWTGDWVEVLPEGADKSLPVIPDNDVRPLREHVIRDWRTNVLPGLTTVIVRPDGKPIGRRYNSAVLLTADGLFGGRYDKIHCV